MYTRTLTRIAGIALAGGALAPIPATTAAIAAGPTHARSLNVRAQLTVVDGTSSCHTGICTLNNHGTGRMTPFGTVTFNTLITADGNAPPCGNGSQWVRATRTIHTDKANLTLDARR